MKWEAEAPHSGVSASEYHALRQAYGAALPLDDIETHRR